MHQKRAQQHPPASLLKQFAAMFYDSLLICSVLIFETAILLPFNSGEAITSSIYKLHLIAIVFIFYSWFWHKTGQTLGMKVWKIRIINEYGQNPSWQISFLRLFFAIISMLCLGVGYFWRLFTPYTWHDRLSHTLIIDESKLINNK